MTPQRNLSARLHPHAVALLLLVFVAIAPLAEGAEAPKAGAAAPAAAPRKAGLGSIGLPNYQEPGAYSVDMVIHSTSSYLPSVMDQLLEILGAGCCVVSTCEELAYPYRKHPDLSAQLDAAAKEEGVAIVGTGVNPGFVMDKLVLTLSAVSQRVEWAKAVRVVDASKRRLPLQKKIGAGMTPEEFRQQVIAGVIKHHGLPESIAMVADGFRSH